MTDVKILVAFGVSMLFCGLVMQALETRIRVIEQKLSAHPEAVKPATPVPANDK